MHVVSVFQVVHSSILLECQRFFEQALVANVVSSQLSIPLQLYDQLQLLADLQIHLYILHDRQGTTLRRAAC